MDSFNIVDEAGTEMAGFRSMDDFMRVEEAAELLGVSRETVRVMCRQRKVPSIHIGRRLFIPKSAMVDYANSILAEQMAG